MYPFCVDFPFLRLLGLALVMLLCVPGAQSAEATKEEALRVAQQVHDIFEVKCLDCHGPELPRPKGKFGYVLDLQRMADNPEYVTRGKPDDSELYKMVLNDEMPGDDAPVPPLTPEEKDIVKRWVEIGAPGELPGGVASEAIIVPGEVARPQKPFFDHLLSWIGKSHPVSTHFPVALMFVAVFAESLAFFTRQKSWLQTVRFLVVLAGLSAVMATGLGWINAAYSSYDKDVFKLLFWHRWLGTISGVWAVICAGLVLMTDMEEGSLGRRRFRGALIAGAGLVGVAGFLGSALIYGLDHYAW